MDARAKQPLRGSNLGEEGQNIRIRMGLGGLLLALTVSVVLVNADVARAWRTLLFFPFFFAAMGAWQGLYRTCPGHVSKGVRDDVGGQTARVRSPDEMTAARCLARSVLVGAGLTAILATALVVALP